MVFWIVCFGMLWAIPFVCIYIFLKNRHKNRRKEIVIVESFVLSTLFSGGSFSLISIAEGRDVLILGWVVCPVVGAILTAIYFGAFISKD